MYNFRLEQANFSNDGRDLPVVDKMADALAITCLRA